MSKHPKPAANKPHTEPNDTGAHKQKCDVSGSVYVRGEVEVKIPVEAVEKQDAAEEKKDSRDRLVLHKLLARIGAPLLDQPLGIFGTLAELGDLRKGGK
jgi:hypothetical protein